MSDKKIGIVYSPGFGAGWSTWGESEQALDQDLAAAIDRKAEKSELMAIAGRNWPSAYLGGVRDLKVEWVEPGTLFEIHEYDGSESIRLMEDPGWQVAAPAQPKGDES